MPPTSYKSHIVLLLAVCFHLQLTTAQKAKPGSGPLEVHLTDDQITEIVDAHNTLRATRSSSNMRYLTWDSELAKIARDYGQKCQFSHNQKADHSVFHNSIGENIYVSRRPLISFQPSTAVQLWFDETKYFHYNERTCDAGKKCGHYTQVVWADTSQVGCSLTMCDYVSDFAQPDSHLFICNYGKADAQSRISNPWIRIQMGFESNSAIYFGGNVYTYIARQKKMMQPFKLGRPCSACSDPFDTCKAKLCYNMERVGKYDKTPRKALPPINVPDNQPDTGLTDEEVLQSSLGKSLLTAVIMLSIFCAALMVYVIYRERVRLSLKLQIMKTSTRHKNFSNQNTPRTSRATTPRHSIGNLHGLHNDLISSPMPQQPVVNIKLTPQNRSSELTVPSKDILRPNRPPVPRKHPKRPQTIHFGER